MIKTKSVKKFIAVLANVSLLLNSFIPFLLAVKPVYAEDEITQIPTEVTIQEPTPTETPIITEITPTIEPTITPEVIENSELVESAPEITQTPEITPTPEVTPTPEEVTPIPTTETQNSDNNSNNSSAPTETPVASDNPATVGPTPTVSAFPNVSTQITNNGSIQTTVVQNNTCRTDILNPSLSTDKGDYTPTEIAIISGQGFMPNTQYFLHITSDGLDSTYSISSDSNGAFTYSYQLDGNYRPEYKVEAKDSENRIVATMTFLDYQNFSIKINNDAVTTTDSSVTINLSWETPWNSLLNPAEIRFANVGSSMSCDDSSVVWSSWESVNNNKTRSWTISDGYGTKKVCSQTTHFGDFLHIFPEKASDTIEYVAPNCTYVYSDWGVCNISNTRVRTIISTTPNGCQGTPENLVESCTYIPQIITINNPNNNPAQSKTITATTTINNDTLMMSVNNDLGTTLCDGSLSFIPYDSITFNSESDNGKTVCYKAVDGASNTTYLVSTIISGIDKTPPTLNWLTYFTGWYNTDQTADFEYSDTNGIASGTPVSCLIFTEGANQTCSIMPNVCDSVGNCNAETVTSNGANIDKTAPIITATVNQDIPDAQNSWYKTQPEITINASDDNLDKTEYQWDSKEVSGWMDYNSSLKPKPTTEGIYILYFRATDLASNMTEGLKEVKWDQTDPELGPQNISANPNPTSGSTSKIKWEVAKDNIGIDKYEVQWNLNGSSNSYSKTVGSDTLELEIDQLVEGRWTVKVIAFDQSGRSKDNSIDVNVDRTAPSAPTLNLTGTGAGSATLSWNAIDGAKDYIIWYGSTQGNHNFGARVGNVTSYTVQGLGSGNYYFIIKAIDEAQNQSVDSNEVNTGTIIGAPGTTPGQPAEGFSPEVKGVSTQANQSVLGAITQKMLNWWWLLLIIPFYSIYKYLKNKNKKK